MQVGRKNTVTNSPADKDPMPPALGKNFSSPNPPTHLRRLSTGSITDPSSTVPKVGLLNISNTDYMNAALQAILHIRPLTEYFLTQDVEKIINYER